MDFPCRFEADLARYLSQPNETERFDEGDEMHVRAVVPYELAKPVQNLLLTLAEFEMTSRSFGADPEKALEALLPDLKKLRQACIDRWRDI